MNPPPPPPLWERIKNLQDQHEDQRTTIKQLLAENKALKQQASENDALVASQQRRIATLEAQLKSI